MSVSLGELAVRFGCELRGDPDRRVEYVGTLANADAQSVSFLANRKYRRELTQTKAGAVVLERAGLADCPVDALITSNPHALYARIAQLLHPPALAPPGIHPSAVVEPSGRIDPTAHVGALASIGAGAHIGPRAFIGPQCVVGAEVIIEEDVRLTAHVTIQDRVRIGARSILQPGAVVGSDGFGFAQEDGAWLKVPQIGTVVIGQDVEIGANTTIDRGAIEDTVIGDGVKLDNQIQIAHNVHIGAHTVMAACCGISGSTRIGARCMLGGGVGVGGHITICDDVIITAYSGIATSIESPGMYSGGIPAEPAREWRRIVAWLKINGRKRRAGQPEGTDDA
jgi:UDP-3-O-[3-hydroxymyristoyl] glucosamine N-acyltransferase